MRNAFRTLGLRLYIAYMFFLQDLAEKVNAR